MILDESDIPEGPYCYTYEDGEMKLCPFWDMLEDLPRQEDGFCHYLQLGDKDLSMGHLWDQCKECNVNFEHRSVEENG